MSLEERLAPYVELWRLEAEGAAFETHSSTLRPVRFNGRAAMLKLIKFEDEEQGPTALEHFAGDGAVELLARMGWAQVTERASGGALFTEVQHADDDAGLGILCDIAARLHGPRSTPAPTTLVPMRRRFRSLFNNSGRAPIFAQAAQVAEQLIAAPQNEGVLHGDINPTNILWDAARGWLAIDPKGVFGERAYDYAYALMSSDERTQPGRLERQSRIVSTRTGIPLRRLLEFTFASCALSTAWWFEDNPAKADVSSVERALEALNAVPA